MALKKYLSSEGLRHLVEDLKTRYATIDHEHSVVDLTDLQDVAVTDDDNGNVTLIRSSVASGEDDMVALATRLSELEMDVGITETNVDDLDTRVSGLETDAVITTLEVDSLKVTTNSLTSKTTSLETNLNKVKTDINTLDNKLDNYAQKGELKPFIVNVFISSISDDSTENRQHAICYADKTYNAIQDAYASGRDVICVLEDMSAEIEITILDNGVFRGSMIASAEAVSVCLSLSITQENIEMILDMIPSMDSVNSLLEGKADDADLDTKVNKTTTVNGKALSSNITLSASDVGADASGTATSKVNTHNVSTTAHTDIRDSIGNVSETLSDHIDNEANPHGVTKTQVGLSNVDNVKQYSASNPPPYPVTKVNNKTGAITLTAADVGAEAEGYADSAISTHNAATTAHSDIRNLIAEVSEDLSDFIETEHTPLVSTVSNHTSNKNNPHGVTKAQVGLTNVDNVKQYSASNPPPYPVTSVNSKTGAVSLTATDVGADSKGTATNTVNTHNTSDAAHSDIRGLISALTTKVNNFLDVDDTTTDQLSELIALIQDNAEDIEAITSGKVNTSDIINNLTTNVSTKPLSAAQGVALKALIDALDTEIDSKANTSALTSHTGNTSNPHSVTKSQVGLGNVPNVTTNNQTPSYTEASTLTAMSSGETVSTAFGKIAKAVSTLISHLADKSNPHDVTKSQVGLGSVDNVKQYSASNPPPYPVSSVNGKTGTVSLTASDVKADASGTASSAVSTHNSSDTAHIDIRDMVSELDTEIGNVDTALDAHKASTSNPHNVTKAQVGLGNVENKSSATIRGEITSSNISTALGYTPAKDSLASTTEDGLMSLTDKSKMDYTNIAIGTCSTGAATAAKIVTVSGNTNWSLAAGSIISIKFTYTNTANNPTFNVNGTGAKPVWYNTSVVGTSSLSYGGYADRPMLYIYDGTQYIFTGWSYDTNTTYTNVKLGHGYATCSTAAATTAKVGSLSSYTLTTGGIVAVKFTYDVPASSTLNINSKGAKSIYHKGEAIKAGVIKAGDTATFIYSSQYHLLSVDRDEDTVYTHPTYTALTGVPTANATPAFGGTFTVTQPASDATGHITSMTSRTITIPSAVATTSAAGLMSKDDKTKLNGIATGATANTGTITEIKANGTSVATSGSANIPAASTSAYGVTKLSSSTSSSSTSLAATASAVKAAYDLANGKADTTVASTTSNGLMSSTDKEKLNGIAANANNYTHPSYTAKSSGFYKVTVDASGHVSAATAVAKSDITALGIPAQDTVYTLPTASSTLGGVKTTSTVTSTSGLTACPIISGVPYYKDTVYSLPTASSSTKGGIKVGSNLTISSGTLSVPAADNTGTTKGVLTLWGANNCTTFTSDDSVCSVAAVRKAFTIFSGVIKENYNDTYFKAQSHIYMVGSSASSSTANTTQLVFGTPSAEHIAVTSNAGALVLNPSTTTTTNQIVLYLDKASKFPKGIEGNCTSATKLQTSRTIALTGAVTGSVSFNGSANVSMETTLDPLYTYGTEDLEAGVSPLATGKLYFVYE